MGDGGGRSERSLQGGFECLRNIEEQLGSGGCSARVRLGGRADGWRGRSRALAHTCLPVNRCWRRPGRSGLRQRPGLTALRRLNRLRSSPKEDDPFPGLAVPGGGFMTPTQADVEALLNHGSVVRSQFRWERLDVRTGKPRHGSKIRTRMRASNWWEHTTAEQET